MRQILFSCIGTSDPLRGEHDGPMLHIMRQYRPEAVFLFFTPEMDALRQQDHRFERMREWIRDHWDGYAPDWKEITCDVADPHNMDALDQPIRQAVAQAAASCPDARLLINLTSGTPQMQMILSQLSMDIRYHSVGVQVGNFEHSSGRSERANHGNYDIEIELEFNEDENEASPNRCIQPQMFAIQREYTRRQIEGLLEHRNFDALEELSGLLPETLSKLAIHLAARNRLQPDAKKLAGELKGLPFPLYAYKNGERKGYTAVCEYYLMMRNLAKSGRYAQFLLHMEPLTLTLQLALLDKLLGPMGLQRDSFIIDSSGKKIFDPDRLSKVSPNLYAHYTACMQKWGWTPQRKEISTYVCNDLLSFFAPLPPQAQALFSHYESLKELRNRLAHDLYTCTDGDIRRSCGVDANSLLREAEAVIAQCYSACDPAIFNVYDRCIDYFRRNL